MNAMCAIMMADNDLSLDLRKDLDWQK